MQCEYVINLFKFLRKFGSLIRLVCLIHHPIEFEVFLGPTVFSLAKKIVALFNYRVLSMFNHKVFLESLSFLFIINFFQFLLEYGQWISLSEFFTFRECCLPDEFSLENFCIVANTCIHMLSQHGVELPQAWTQGTRTQGIWFIFTIGISWQLQYLGWLTMDQAQAFSMTHQ